MLVVFHCFLVLLVICKTNGSEITVSLSVSPCFSPVYSLSDFLSFPSRANEIFLVLPWSHFMYVYEYYANISSHKPRRSLLEKKIFLKIAQCGNKNKL